MSGQSCLRTSRHWHSGHSSLEDASLTGNFVYSPSALCPIAHRADLPQAEKHEDAAEEAEEAAEEHYDEHAEESE